MSIVADNLNLELYGGCGFSVSRRSGSRRSNLYSRSIRFCFLGRFDTCNSVSRLSRVVALQGDPLRRQLDREATRDAVEKKNRDLHHFHVSLQMTSSLSFSHSSPTFVLSRSWFLPLVRSFLPQNVSKTNTLSQTNTRSTTRSHVHARTRTTHMA